MTRGSSNLSVMPPLAWEPGGCSWPELARNGLCAWVSTWAAMLGPKWGGGKFTGKKEFIGIELGVGVNFLVVGWEMKLPMLLSF